MNSPGRRALCVFGGETTYAGLANDRPLSAPVANISPAKKKSKKVADNAA